MPKKLSKAASIFYPIVQQWLQKHFACFKTAVNKGLRHGRIDIIGVRDVGGDLSGAIETIGIDGRKTANRTCARQPQAINPFVR